ncbi:co-chaperone GroES [bacterium (Candidatus Blackallbacteria) CG17_big_fil_post_rev_8_21_14_2_50_48_46]|uniref:Co-chaperonin GroES n=1 Tax=bacterium (Candidatus Blackallbacteria) CG17_big_fil_post_rev_8_21_14_2_50_48_46 TaxID=2014261 RepID=A0A2M7G7B0_9BACT|nr:MAG: hypothetical protein COW64_12140 [bacterium (Candidatus Blackallbacteria) CG18_big_fil_WC_8_21_14_2_50_49_26]PIW17962.1 MAG: co-chaperone GroES [bacterium (Candidatus Blackallbacteria) CG17_big_fil_post_rev_8_21_14_2_50_48_46]PIW45785.1 MAG: co-chaperone GroES [bacterium (Candidatus Blackallbacteria) CG13_big_fil_rev_8_21_14_2_50_49_14]
MNEDLDQSIDSLPWWIPQPLGARALIRPDGLKDKTAGGIYLPDQAKEEPTEGVIANLGPGHKLKDGTYAPLEVKIGQRVIYNKWGATEIKEQGETFVIVREEDILGIIHGGEIDDDLLPAF